MADDTALPPRSAAMGLGQLHWLIEQVVELQRVYQRLKEL